MKGVVIKSTGSWYDVLTENGDVLKARLKGVFRLDESKEKDSNPVAVGDNVSMEQGENDETYTIKEIEERRNYIVRTSPKHKGARQIIAANMDQCLLIATMANPRTSMGFIDRFLITAEAYHIPAIIVFNKQDLLDVKTKSKQQHVAGIYSRIGYKTIFTSAETGEGLEELKGLLKNKTTLVSGHSGVGKSSLLNLLEPELDLRTGEISKFSGKGMHTTTFAEMHLLDNNARVIDTPGIREFGLLDFKPEEISHYYIEMRELLTECKFNNCLHENEPGCAVKKAYEDGRIAEERYVSYLNIMTDYKNNYKHWE
ncbi:MAG: ribosome small subunit-dependent GTPase A [Chitinophagales bacterium]